MSGCSLEIQLFTNSLYLRTALFPFASTYTHVYDHFSLLQQNTVLAHCVHLDQDEMDIIKARESGVSHCPKYAACAPLEVVRSMLTLPPLFPPQLELQPSQWYFQGG